MRSVLLRDVYSYGIYFTTYEAIKRKLAADHTNPDPITSLIAGGFAGTLAWFSCYPIDVVKTRLQTSSKYQGIIDCFIKSYIEDGKINNSFYINVYL